MSVPQRGWNEPMDPPCDHKNVEVGECYIKGDRVFFDVYCKDCNHYIYGDVSLTHCDFERGDDA